MILSRRQPQPLVQRWFFIFFTCEGTSKSPLAPQLPPPTPPTFLIAAPRRRRLRLSASMPSLCILPARVPNSTLCQIRPGRPGCELRRSLGSRARFLDRMVRASFPVRLSPRYIFNCASSFFGRSFFRASNFRIMSPDDPFSLV